MRNKAFLLLALFAAFSTASYAQTATATHNVTSDLTEVRTIVLAGGAAVIAVKRSVAGNTLYTNSLANMTVEHDMAFNQKVVVSTVLGAGVWTGRSLYVGAVPPVDPTWAASTIATTTLVLSGVAQPASTFITNIPSTGGGPTLPLTLDYSGAAGLTAVAGSAIAAVTYNLTDG